LTGFHSGLTLLQGLLEKYWDEIHPILDPEDDLDPTARVNILEELNNFESVLRPLSLMPLINSKSAGRFSLRDIHLATDKLDVPEDTVKPDIGLIKAAFIDVAAEVVAASYQAINETIDIVQKIDALVGEKVGIENGPDLSGLATLLKEMQHVFENYAVAELSGSGAQPEEEDLSEGAIQPVSSRKPVAIGGVNSRQDVLKTLDLICKYYAEHEPSSPVPILLNRAKKLVTADFMQIVENLLPDSMSQLQQIKGPDPEADQY